TGANVTNATVGTLAPGSYLVRVRALGDGASYCDGPWSANCSFEVIEPCEELPTPTIVSVGGAACGGQTQDTSPVLVWSDIANDTGYRWEVRDSFGNPIASGTTGQNVTSATVGTLAPGAYIARVQAVGDGVEFCDSPWTAYCSFQVVGECEPLQIPVVTAVGDTTCGGQTFDQSPTLRWTDIANETGYRWQVRNTSGVPIAGGSTPQNQASANPGILEVGSYTARVQATGDGVNYCTSEWSSNCGFEIKSDIGVADFTWWPEQPKRDQKVRFADRSTGTPTGWLWESGDGWTSTEENPSHRFQMTGEWDVAMTCQYPGGTDTKIWTVDVAGVVICGDGVCEGQETAWSCADDCGLPPDASGRAGGSDRRPSVPAAVGGVGGTGGTFWLTEGWIFNPNPDSLPLVFEYTPLGSTEIMTAGPFDLGPETGLYWENLVEDLFATTGNGALWLDAPMPVHFLTRSYNQAATGTFGQAVRGLRDKLTIGRDDGEVTLVGLRHDDIFRSNLFFQEVDGEWVTLEVEVFNASGQRLRSTTFDVEGHSNLLRNLGSLGGGGQASAYATVEVVAGDGRVNVISSVVDQITGDPTTIDAIHSNQVVAKRDDGGSIAAETHHLVAVVAHTQGAADSVWGTRFVINSPIGTADQDVRFVYIPEYDRTGVVGDRLERTVTIQGGHQLAWEDVMIDLFALPQSAKTQGALHVYSDAQLLINSRTYNRMAGGGTLGQLIKALSAGDLVDSNHSGTIVGMSHSLDSRTNIGIAAFSDADTEVELSFFSNFPALRSIGSITVTVPSQSHLQVTKIFDALGLDDTPLPSVHALVEVTTGGAVYVYASMVDNATGDPTTIEATRN
ncbi:MAG: PKD domain-containing protein, partial [Holophagae bacterium]